MFDDPIVTEVRNVRDEIASRFNYDVLAIGEYYLKLQEQSAIATTSRPPKAPITTDQAVEGEEKLSLAVKLFEEGKLSLGQAAELAGFSLRAFIDVLGHHRVPVFNYPPEDLDREVNW